MPLFINKGPEYKKGDKIVIGSLDISKAKIDVHRLYFSGNGKNLSWLVLYVLKAA